MMKEKLEEIREKAAAQIVSARRLSFRLIRDQSRETAAS